MDLSRRRARLLGMELGWAEAENPTGDHPNCRAVVLRPIGLSRDRIGTSHRNSRTANCLHRGSYASET